MPRHGTGTRAVHGRRTPHHRALTTPIVQSSTFAFASSEEMRRYLAGDDESLHLYTRYENPTLHALEDALAALEEGEAGLVFASGMAAATTGILSLLQPGDEVLASASLYGGTTRFVREIAARPGVPEPDHRRPRPGADPRAGRSTEPRARGGEPHQPVPGRHRPRRPSSRRPTTAAWP